MQAMAGASMAPCFDVKYNTIPLFISPLPSSRIDISFYNNHAFVSGNGFVTERDLRILKVNNETL